jgi:predicted ribosome quality control (RQC) complex YloA/Tae2 family protein
MNTQPPNQNQSAPPSAPSTGPRTQAGKAISSQNSRKHDLCSRTLRLTPEEWAEYNEMCERYRRDFQPANDVEQTLIDEICFNYWRLQQAREVEFRIVTEHPFDLPIISLYIRYRAGYERAFYKALDKLQQTQRIRKQEAAKAEPVRSEKAATAPLSTENIAETALHLEDQVETHLLENKVRAKLLLPPLEIPKKLASRLDEFVSQNPNALSDELLGKLKEAV